MATTANAQEKLQCLAFAYFALNRSKSSLANFRLELETVDSQTTNLKYRPYLTASFNFRKVAEKFSNPKSVADKNWVTSTYAVAEKFYKTNIITPFSEYVFLDQDTQFTQSIKDRSLAKYKSALKFTGEIDLLSSIDMFMVKKTKLTKIYRDFKDNILNADDFTLLNNLAYGNTGKNTYRTIINKYFSPREGRALVPVSLKKSAKDPQITFVGTTINIDQPQIKLDPYTEFVSRAFTSTPQELKKLIEEAVEIDLDNMKIDHVVYNIPFTINYAKVDVTDSISQNVLTLQAGNGFNVIPKGKPYGGGASFSSSEYFLKQYSEYNRIMNELKVLRRNAFNYAITGSTSKTPVFLKGEEALKSLYNEALRELTLHGVLYMQKDHKAIYKFFDEYSKTKNVSLLGNYYKILSNLCKKRNINTDVTIQKYQKQTTNQGRLEVLRVDYINAQGLWFFSRGGTSLYYFLKQRLILTLYGLITKKGSLVYKNVMNGTIVESAIRSEFKKNNKTVVANFQLAPHILID
jgi:hypothetical protein